jgi:hypothetical protein
MHSNANGQLLSISALALLLMKNWLPKSGFRTTYLGNRSQAKFEETLARLREN